MSLRSLLFLAATAMLAVQAAAQCPKTRAKTIAETLVFHGNQDCGGVKFSIAGVTVTTTEQGCPLLAAHTPAHEIEVATTAETRVRVTQKLTAWAYFFKCEQVWYAIIPWGSSCVLDRVVATTPLNRLATVACAATP